MKEHPNQEPHLCMDCRGDSLPPARLSEYHVAVRFGDQRRYRVFFEEHDISDYTPEAQAGRDGWIIKWCALGPNRTAVPCERCHQQLCAWRLRGSVRVESV